MRFPPDQERDNPYSLEQFIDEYPIFASTEVSLILVANPRIVSILKTRTRRQTGLLMGGGELRQSFKWSEQHLGCGLENLPFSVRLNLLDVR